MIWTQDSAFVLNANEIELRSTKGEVQQYRSDGNRSLRAHDYMDLNFRGDFPTKMSVWANLR